MTKREFPVEERQQVILLLCALCTVVPVSSENITKAIGSNYTADLEDALQVQCAVESDCDYFITRDAELFEKCTVKTLLPHDLISELSL